MSGALHSTRTTRGYTLTTALGRTLQSVMVIARADVIHDNAVVFFEVGLEFLFLDNIGVAMVEAGVPFIAGDGESFEPEIRVNSHE